MTIVVWNAADGGTKLILFLYADLPEKVSDVGRQNEQALRLACPLLRVSNPSVL